MARQQVETYLGALHHQVSGSSTAFIDNTTLPPRTISSQRRMGIDPADTTPFIPRSLILQLPRRRPGRRLREHNIDPSPTTNYGSSIQQKDPTSTRFLFQNIKGLTYSTSGEDYKYLLSCLHGYQVDIAGLAETNTCWSHSHLTSEFRNHLRKQFKQSKVTFSSPSTKIDPCHPKESFQAGGTLSIATGDTVSQIQGDPIIDKTGLGRWSGLTFQSAKGSILSIITGYRSCAGSVQKAPLGSTFLREYTYLREEKNMKSPNPRREFLTDLTALIIDLQTENHAIMLMLDANSLVAEDSHFQTFLAKCQLLDLHRNDPAPSTYIGASARRIDYIFGCERVDQNISRAGTLSYTDGPQSDHRALYVDLHLSNFFHSNNAPMEISSRRAIQSGNPEKVLVYNSKVRHYYDNHNMINRMETLLNTHTQMSRDELRVVLTKWDDDQGRAMLSAEKYLRTSPKPYQWSPQLRNAGVIMRYWKLRLREVINQEDYADTFKRWQSKLQHCDSSFSLPLIANVLSANEIRLHLNKATKTLRKCQRDATSLRIQSYQDLILTYDEDQSVTRKESMRKRKVVERTISTEMCRAVYRNIGHTVKPSTSQSLSRVNVPRPQDTFESTAPGNVHKVLRSHASSDLIWDTVVTKEEMEAHLLSYNREAFRSAAQSPCGHGALYDAITFSSLSPASQQLLEGSIPPDWDVQDATLTELLASFAAPSQVQGADPIVSTFTPEDLTKGFTSWKESTTTSPSGRHLGHYKALIQDPVLLQCLTDFLNLSILRGIAVPRWCNATNVMIEKDEGKPNIDRLRIIHLFEADFNFFLKLQWGHRLVRRADEFDLLHDGQYGSRPRRTPIDPIMLIQLTTDLSRLLKKNLARFDNDASACYDRIIVGLGMLAARRCGMPSNAIQTHASALSLMKYTVKTIYGVSEQSYQGTVFEPLFGTGQGSGASPAIWLSLVVILLNTLDRIIPQRTTFESVDGRIVNSRLVDAFVDDTSLGFTDDALSYNVMITTLQTISQTWEHLLHLSGGALNLKKCSWYVLFWDWVQGRPMLREHTPEDPTICLTQGSTTEAPVPIRMMDHKEAPRILGVHLSPLGDFSTQIRVCKDKADSFALKLHSPRLTPTDIRIFHRSIYTPSMRYPLAAMAVDEEALQSIQSRIIPVILQKLHVNRNLPTAIRHGPSQYGGLELYDVRTEAGLEAIKYLRNAIYGDTAAGRLILTNLQHAQVESGIGEALLEHPTIQIPYLTPTWLTSIRQYMSQHNVTLTVTQTFHNALQTPTDQYIMNRTYLARYTPQQQRDINLVRLHLQVTTLADITDTHRPTAIHLSYLDGRRPPGFLLKEHQWPRQPVVSNLQRRLWKRYLSSSYMRYIPLRKNPPTSTARRPLRSAPSTEPLDSRSSLCLTATIALLPRSSRRLLSNLSQLVSDLELWKALSSRQRLYIASDGGLSGSHGTFGWILSSAKKTLLTCSGPVDGPNDTGSSTRSELCGYASALLLLRTLSKRWNRRHRCKFTWLVDSKAAITRVRRFTARGHRPVKQPYDADLLALIVDCTTHIRRPIKCHWIKGHQDSKTDYSKLPLATRLNIDADHLATSQRTHGKDKPSTDTDHQPSQRVSMSINGTRITSQYDSCLRFHINGYHHRRYLQMRYDWNDKTWNSIDFTAFGRHFRSLPPNIQISHMKLIHDQQPLGARRFKSSPVADELLKRCPCCKKADENQTHFLQCTANPAQAVSLAILRKSILTADSHPTRYLLDQGLRWWLSGHTNTFQPDLSSYPPHLRALIDKALETQEQIGWHNAVKGYLSIWWRKLASRDSINATDDQESRGLSRISSILKALSTFTRSLWLSRNTVLHSDDADNLITRSTEAAEITFLHNNSQLLRFDDRYLCRRSLSGILKGAPSTRRRWLRLVKRSVEQNSIEAARQTSITSFFPRVR